MPRPRPLRRGEPRPQPRDGSRSDLRRRRTALRQELAQLRPGGWQRVRPPEKRSQAGAPTPERASSAKEATPRSSPREGPAPEKVDAPALRLRVPPAEPASPPERKHPDRRSKALVWTFAGLSSALALGLGIFLARRPKGPSARRARAESTKET